MSTLVHPSPVVPGPPFVPHVVVGVERCGADASDVTDEPRPWSAGAPGA